MGFNILSKRGKIRMGRGMEGVSVSRRIGFFVGRCVYLFIELKIFVLFGGDREVER